MLLTTNKHSCPATVAIVIYRFLLTNSSHIRCHTFMELFLSGSRVYHQPDDECRWLPQLGYRRTSSGNYLFLVRFFLSDTPNYFVRVYIYLFFPHNSIYFLKSDSATMKGSQLKAWEKIISNKRVSGDIQCRYLSLFIFHLLSTIVKNT